MSFWQVVLTFNSVFWVSSASRRQPSTPTSKTAKRAASALKTGLVHVTSLQAGVPIPDELQQLDYRAVILELGRDEGDSGVHAYVHRLVQRGVPVLVTGTDTDVMYALQALKHAAADEPLTSYDVVVYRPGKPADKYLYSPSKMTILTNSSVGYKVSTQLVPCCVAALSC